MVLWGHVICGGQFWEKVGHNLDNTIRGEKHMAVRQFWRGRSDPRKHRGIAPLDKCHYNFLVALFSLQYSRILLWIKIYVSTNSVLHQIKSQYTEFLLL